MIRNPAKSRVCNSLRSVLIAENMILKRFGANKSRWTFHVKFYSMIRFRGKSHVLNSLHFVVAENMILKRFGANKKRSTFHVRFSWMIRFRAKWVVLKSLHSVVAQNIIFKRFLAIKSRSKSHVRFCYMIRFGVKSCLELPTFSSSQKHDF